MPSTTRRRRLLTSVLVLVTAVSGVVAVLLLLEYRQSDQVTAEGVFVSTDLAGNQVQWDVPPDVEGSAVQETGGYFAAPELGLSVPLMTAELAGGAINPPTMTDAFRYRDYGSPDEAGSGLVVVALHAVRDGQAPGNAFVELAEHGEPTVVIGAGDVLEVDGHRYEVTDTDVVGKTDATRSTRIWGEQQERDGELVVITCLQRPGQVGNAVENVVVYAERLDG